MSSSEFLRCESLGAFPLGEDLAEAMALLSRDIFHELEAEEFSGDPVQTRPLPEILQGDHPWIAAAELSARGLRPVADRTLWQLVSTASVDAHQDVHGPTLLWTLHNDGLKLKVGRKAWVPALGELILFDDRQPHEVCDVRASASVLLLVSVPLQLF